MNHNQFRVLCIKEVSGNINDAEKKILNNWLNKSEENRTEYERIRNIWIRTAPDVIPLTSNTDTGWFALYDRLVQDSPSVRKYNFIKPKLRPVLVGALAILLLFVSIYIVSSEEHALQLKTITTLSSEHKEVHLSDGSVVLLNGGSVVKFYEIFTGNTREINLKGEAFFSVNKDGRSFIVRTDNAKTTVLGTKFNVRTNDDKTEVFVKEGKVSLQQSKLSSGAVVLSNGQFSTVSKDQLPESPRKIDPHVLSWIEGKLVFNQTTLTEIVDELERFYKIPVAIEKDNDLKNYTLTGSFNNQAIDSVLTMICTALYLDFEKQNEGYVIKSKSIN